MMIARGSLANSVGLFSFVRLRGVAAAARFGSCYTLICCFALLSCVSMHHIVYTSTANVFLNEEEMRRALCYWRTKNARLGITGVLLYSEGQIMQVLEGEAEAVHALYANIAADVRHRSVTKLADGPVLGRTFADWSIRFRTVDTVNFMRFAELLDAAPDHASGLAPLLESFMAQGPWN